MTFEEKQSKRRQVRFEFEADPILRDALLEFIDEIGEPTRRCIDFPTHERCVKIVRRDPGYLSREIAGVARTHKPIRVTEDYFHGTSDVVEIDPRDYALMRFDLPEVDL